MFCFVCLLEMEQDHTLLMITQKCKNELEKLIKFTNWKTQNFAVQSAWTPTIRPKKKLLYWSNEPVQNRVWRADFIIFLKFFLLLFNIHFPVLCFMWPCKLINYKMTKQLSCNSGKTKCLYSAPLMYFFFSLVSFVVVYLFSWPFCSIFL